MPETVTLTTYSAYNDILNGLNMFYLQHVESVVPVQVFESLTYGEMMISVILLTFLILFCLKWIWEVLR